MGKLLAFGSNGSGQLGIGHFDDVAEPTSCPIDLHGQDGIKIAAGGNHTLVLGSDGRLFAAGDNSDGRCLIPSHSPNAKSGKVPGFQLVQCINQPVKLCSATWEASVVIPVDNKVIVAGTGMKGELGLGDGIRTALAPTVIPDFPPKDTQIIDIASCMDHIVLVLSNGEAWGWGNGRKGQLGEPRGHLWLPRKIANVSFPATRAICGKEFTFIAGPPGEGGFAILGSDKWRIHSDAPQNLGDWVDISASWGSVFVLQKSGQVLSWGRNDRKQLFPKHASDVVRLGIGSEHGLCLTKDSAVLAWGWGEHGNCGDLKQLQSNNSSGTVVHPNGEVLALGAGCATSWIFLSG